MTTSEFVVAFFVLIFILLISHLTVDRDIPEKLKVGAWVFFIVVAVLYMLFGIIL